MNFFALFAVSVLIGAVYCGDADCFNRKVTSCNQRVLDNLEGEPESCPVILKQSKCVLSAAIDCQMAFIMKAQQADIYLQKVCDGSYKSFEENRKCYVPAVLDLRCYKPIDKIMTNKTARKELLKAQKEACTQVYWFERCMITQVEDECGESKYEVFSTVFTPLVDLYLAYCKDVVIPAKEDSDQYFTFGLPSIFDLMRDLFHYD